MKTVWNVVYWDDDTEPVVETFSNEEAAEDCFNEYKTKYPSSCYMEQCDTWEQFRKKPCILCHCGMYIDDYTSARVNLIEDNWLIFDNSGNEYPAGKMLIKYCPVCGRKL